MSPPTALYRCYDAFDVLLYVGQTMYPETRFATHARESSWWPKVHRHTLEWFDVDGDAARAEVAAIAAERPVHNVHPGGSGRPFGGGPTKIRAVRIGDLWTQAMAIAKSRDESMSDILRPGIERGLRRYINQHRSGR